MSYDAYNRSGRRTVSNQQIGKTCEQCGTSYFAIEIDVRGVARTDVCGCEVSIVDMDSSEEDVDRGDGPITDGGDAIVVDTELIEETRELIRRAQSAAVIGDAGRAISELEDAVGQIDQLREVEQ